MRPSWLAGTISIAISLALHHPQAIDVLVSIRADEGFFSLEHGWLLLSLLTLSVCGWYFARSLLYVEYAQTPSVRDDVEPWRRWWPRVIGVVPIVSVALAHLRAGLFGFGLFYALLGLAFLLAVIFRRRLLFPREPYELGWYPALPRRTLIAMLGLIAVSFVVLIVFLVSPVTAPQQMGPIGILFFAMATWIAFGSAALIYPTYRYRLPSLLGTSLLLVALFSLWNDNHGVRTLPGEADDWQRESVVEHVSAWLAEREPARARYAAEGRPYPVFLVAAEGGGIRAAYWTASVLAGLEDAYPGFACHVLATSGVSGGSLGGAVFSALIAEQVELSGYRCDGVIPDDLPPLLPRARGVLAEDFLAPPLAGMFFPDFLQRFLPTTGSLALPDRARYLEKAWELAWRKQAAGDRFDAPFRELWAGDGSRYRVPSLFLNGTWVGTGNRVVTSNLQPISSEFVRLGDAIDVLDRPIRLSTAVHMSARFTYLSPAGTVPTSSGRRRVVDGGYFENSGALTASEIFGAFQASGPHPGVEVHALIVGNDPRHPAAPQPADARPAASGRFLPETLSPVRAIFNTRVARGHHADERLVQAVDGRVLRFQLDGRGDNEAPLGWVLSGETRRRLDSLAVLHPTCAEVGALLSAGRR